jgi:hypothetical protein
MITFVCMPSRTSGEIRGKQVSERLGGLACYTDIHNPDWKKLGRNKIVLFCRTWEGNLAKELKKQGHVVGYDMADMMVGDAVFRNKAVADLRDYVHSECDFFVVNNEVQRSHAMMFAGSRPVFTIPHHSTNFSGVVAPFRTKPERVGYVGLPEQLSAKDEINSLCAKHAVEFVSVHPSSREECDQVFRSLDVGLVFAESDSTMRPDVVALMKRYKPNTKLTNFQSYGVPTICTPYQSYIEFGECACRFVDTKEAMLTTLDELLTHPYARIELSNAALIVGRKFHIDELIKTRYLPMIEAVSK